MNNRAIQPSASLKSLADRFPNTEIKLYFRDDRKSIVTTARIAAETNHSLWRVVGVAF